MRLDDLEGGERGAKMRHGSHKGKRKGLTGEGNMHGDGKRCGCAGQLKRLDDS